MDPKSDERIFLGYSINSRAYRVYNNRTQVVMESINVVIDNVAKKPVPEVVPGVEAYPEISTQEKVIPETVIERETNSEEAELNNAETSQGPSIKVQKKHPQELIIGDPDQGIRTRRNKDIVSNSCFVSKCEPKIVKEALTDDFWIEAMQEELNQFKRSEVWDLVPRPNDINVIGTKWIYKNKSDENGTVTRNKARLVAQG